MRQIQKSSLAHLLYILYLKVVENGFTQCLLFNYFPRFVVSYSYVNGEDYICITDMLKAKDGDFFVTDWLRNRNTMEFLGMWERIYNPNFNYGEFATIRNQSGLNSFKISVKEFVARTGAISLQAKAGRYGGNFH